MKRITCRDLAQRLGLHPSTISLALRDHPSLPQKTRDRVKALAAELGYRPDPALSALNAYRIARSRVDYKATLAWINQIPQSRHPLLCEEVFQGASRRAWELGYQLEEFDAVTEEEWKALPRILKSRGIDGILLPPPPKIVRGEGMRGFPWSDFFAVALGYESDLSLHLVINNQFQSAAVAVRELHALGYRKIGLATPPYFSRNTSYRFYGGYVAECERLQIAPLVYRGESALQNPKPTAQWLRKNRPEVLIAPGSGDILPALEEARLRVPGDIALAYLYREPAHPEISAIDQNDRQIGVEGANQLVDLIRRNARGPSDYSMHYLVEGRWFASASTPRRLASGSTAVP